MPGKLDPHLQELFIRKYRRLRKTPGENDVILFADAVHPTYQMIASYGGMKKGKEKELQTNSGRE
ncbi:MAG: IS630 family transposase, partial [Planctomycetaceae bacterium]|nr:IS630 family transposase [Planctomycetaceae bacterium]